MDVVGGFRWPMGVNNQPTLNTRQWSERLKPHEAASGKHPPQMPRQQMVTTHEE
jgi:hypothetical protein